MIQQKGENTVGFMRKKRFIIIANSIKFTLQIEIEAKSLNMIN